MSDSIVTGDSAARRAHELYEERIRSEVEPAHLGEFLIVNLETGEYEVDPDDLAASKRARRRFPHARLFTMRVGRPAAYKLGSRFVVRDR
jgi:hypothetical protein